MFGEFCGGIEVSLAECGTTAAAAVFYERNFESERFEHFHGSYAEVRLVSADLLIKLPDALDDRTAAATLLRGLTAQMLATVSAASARRVTNPAMTRRRGLQSTGHILH